MRTALAPKDLHEPRKVGSGQVSMHPLDLGVTVGPLGAVLNYFTA